MKGGVGSILKSAGAARPVAWARGGWHNLRRDPQAVVNGLLAWLARGIPAPGGLAYRLLDHFYLRHAGLPETRSVVADATRALNRLTGPWATPPAGGHALIFLLRGHWYLHTFHQYMVGCALRGLGYRVSFVVCTGSVERCGVMQEGERLLAPPFLCGACRNLTASVSLKGFDILGLSDYRPRDEDEQVETLCHLPGKDASGPPSEGIRLAEDLEPFLVRFFFGDIRKVEGRHEEVLTHLKANFRYLLRLRGLLDRVQPSCLVLFNGLFAPEHLFFKEAQARGIRTLFTERGVRQNTFFLSIDDPACHYRSNQLWERVKDQISADQVRAAEAYLAKRITGPEDPSGVRRDIPGEGDKPFDGFGEGPYVILYAPVTHDTASMGKADPFGGFFPALAQTARLAVTLRKRLVIRSHPDERGDYTPSRYTVRQYLADHGLLHDDYVRCLDSNEKWNPYVLARSASARVVYNGNLGIELPCLGYDVYNIADSHYSDKGFTLDVRSADDLRAAFEPRERTVDPTQKEWALKYLYFFMYVANMPVDHLIDEYSPFAYRWVGDADPEKQQEQLGLIKQRLEFLLDLS